MILLGENFFERIKTHYDSKLPFVLFNDVESNKINGLLQSNDAIFCLKNSVDKGFVFAPFLHDKKDVFIPLSSAEELVCNTFDVLDEAHNVVVKEAGTTKDRHIKLVRKGIDVIRNSTVEKVVLSRVQEVELPNLDFINLFKKLVKNYPQAYCYLWYHPKVGMWMGATPETLLKIDGDRFKTMALAGTQKYIGSLDVVWGEKEREEQHMVTQSILNDLKWVSEDVKVSEVKTVKAGKLLHLRTDISGVLTAGVEEIIDRLHPTPAVCGLPKAEAKEFIVKNEGYNREFYTGFLGTLNMNGKTNLYVNLRCMQYKNDRLLIYVGGGITKDSVPEMEWEETVNKTRTILDVLMK